MKQNWIAAGLLALAAAALSGCDSMTSVHLLGTALGEQEAERFEGTWIADSEDDGAVLFVRHAGQGRLRLAAVDWKDGDFKLERFDAVLTSHDSVVYLNLADPEPAAQQDRPGEGPWYFLFRCHLTEGAAWILYPARVEAFARGVEAGKLGGTVHRNSVTTVWVEGSKDQYDGFVRTELAAAQFELESPLVLRRVR